MNGLMQMLDPETREDLNSILDDWYGEDRWEWMD